MTDTTIDPFAHLLPSVHPVMAEGTEARLKHLEVDRWVGYPRAKTIHNHMEFLLQHEKVDRPPNLLLIGDSNGGKSHVVKRFLKRHPAVFDPHLERTVMPVLFVETPGVPDEGRLYNEILDVFYAGYRVQDHPEKKRRLVYHHIERMDVRLIILDEIHNALAGRMAANRQLMNVIKNISNKLRVPIVATGTLAALRAMQTDEQIANRFEPQALPRWKNDDHWRMFIKRYEETLPLQYPSLLSRAETAEYLYHLSEGLIGELATNLQLAARTAINSGQEKIDLDLLKELKRTPPSQRRSQAEQIMR